MTALRRLEVWLHAGGTIVRKDLQDEELKVDCGCLVGFTSGLEYELGISMFGAGCSAALGRVEDAGSEKRSIRLFKGGPGCDSSAHCDLERLC